MPDNRAKFVFKDVTAVMGNDEETGLAFVFMVKKDGATVVSFPANLGEAKELTSEDMEKFLIITQDSEMLSAIRDAWEKRNEPVQ